MPLDLNSAQKEGRLRHVMQRPRVKAVPGEAPEGHAGEQFPLRCQVGKLGELGPGVPLYFDFLRIMIGILSFCNLLYGLVAFQYWNTHRVRLEEADDGAFKPLVKGRLSNGTNMDEWRRGWFTGGCGRGMHPLWWSRAAGRALKVEPTLREVSWPRWPARWLWANLCTASPEECAQMPLWLTAAARGPWLGDAPSESEGCPSLDVAVRAASGSGGEPALLAEALTLAPAGDEAAQGTRTFKHCGRHRGLPLWWLHHNATDPSTTYVIFADGDGDQARWLLAAWPRTASLPSGCPRAAGGTPHASSSSTFSSSSRAGTFRPPQVASRRSATWAGEVHAERRASAAAAADLPGFEEAPLHPPLARSAPHRGGLPPALLEWPDTGDPWSVVVNWSAPQPKKERDRCAREAGAPGRLAGVEPLRCTAVVELCDGCTPSAFSRWANRYFGTPMDEAAPSDVDVLLVSCACLVCFSVAVPCLRQHVRGQSVDMEMRTLSADKYTVFVRGLPSSLQDLDESEVALFLQSTLDRKWPTHHSVFPQRGAHHVVKVTYVFRLGHLFFLLARERRALQMRQRLARIVSDLEEDELALLSRQRRLRGWGLEACLLRLRLCCLRCGARRARRAEESWRRKRGECLQRLGKEQRQLKVAGAIVTFEHTFAAQRAIATFTPTPAGWWSSGRVPRRFKGNLLVVRQCHEPTDIVWRHYGEPPLIVATVRTCGFLLACMLFLGLASLIYLLNKAKNYQRKRADDHKRTWQEVLLYYSMGPAIICADIVLREILAQGAVLEMQRIWTMASVSALWKHTVATIITSVVVILQVHIEGDHQGITCEQNWYLEGSLLEDIIVLSCTNMLIQPLLLLFPPWGNSPIMSRLKRMLVNVKTSRVTQEQLVELYSGVEYRMAYRYACVFRTLFLTLLYAPLAPIIMPIGVAGLVLQYWADKACLLRIARRPPWQDLHVGRHANKVLPCILAPIPLLTVFLLRGTSYPNVVHWIKPCISFQSPARLSKRLWGLRLYILSPPLTLLVCGLVAGGLNSVSRCLKQVASLCVRAAVGVFRCLRSCAQCISRRRARSFTGATAPPAFDAALAADAEVSHSISYYDAQNIFPLKYHRVNPVYAALPESVNPEIIQEPEEEPPAGGTHEEASKSRLRDRTNGVSPAHHVVGGVGECAMTLRVALQALVDGSLDEDASDGSDGESADGSVVVAAGTIGGEAEMVGLPRPSAVSATASDTESEASGLGLGVGFFQSHGGSSARMPSDATASQPSLATYRMRSDQPSQRRPRSRTALCSSLLRQQMLQGLREIDTMGDEEVPAYRSPGLGPIQTVWTQESMESRGPERRSSASPGSLSVPCSVGRAGSAAASAGSQQPARPLTGELELAEPVSWTASDAGSGGLPVERWGTGLPSESPREYSGGEGEEGPEAEQGARAAAETHQLRSRRQMLI